MSIERIALTGGSGTLGRAIIKRLTGREDVSVLALHRTTNAQTSGENVRHVVTNFGDGAKVESVLKEFEPTLFIHAAATGMQRPRPDSETLNDVNVTLPMRLAQVVSRLNDCSFLHISSGLAYKDQGRSLREDDPLDTSHVYGASKAQAERELKAFALASGISLIIVRPFSFTGEGDTGTRFFPSLLQNASTGRPFGMSAGDQVRDHSSVDDIAAGILAAASLTSKSNALSVYNLGSGDTRRLRDLVQSVIDQLQLRVEMHFGACPVAPDEPMFMVPDLSHVRHVLGWRTEENIAHAVWRLARTSFPMLNVTEPARTLPLNRGAEAAPTFTSRQ